MNLNKKMPKVPCLNCNGRHDAGKPCKITLDDKQWKQFNESLQRPPREIPELVKLFSTKPVWEREE